jgi:hypothetical protein
MHAKHVKERRQIKGELDSNIWKITTRVIGMVWQYVEGVHKRQRGGFYFLYYFLQNMIREKISPANLLKTAHKLLAFVIN